MSSAHADSKAGLADNPLYLKVVFALLAAILIATTARFSGLAIRPEHNKVAVDFHAFYLAAQLVWRGEIDKAYHAVHMFRLLAETGREGFLPWAYPPQYNLLMAPLALLPVGAAYVVFMCLTLGAYLAVVRHLAGVYFTTVVLSILPALAVTAASGQNGFLTGALVGWTCIGLLRARWSAGLPLGLMVIKPHLVVGLALHTVLTGRWRVVAVAAITVATTGGLATSLLGDAIWTAFLGGLGEARIFLEAGLYPLYRMFSPYSALRSLGVPAPAALACHALVAIGSLALIGVAVVCRKPLPQQLGLAVLASLLVSPYAYDYDLPILGIGLALLLPDLLAAANRREQAAVLGLGFFTSALGVAHNAVLEMRFGANATPADALPASLGGFTMMLLLLLTWRILGRSEQPCEPRSSECPDLKAMSRTA